MRNSFQDKPKGGGRSLKSTKLLFKSDKREEFRKLKICPVKKVRLFASRDEHNHFNSHVLRRKFRN